MSLGGSRQDRTAHRRCCASSRICCRSAPSRSILTESSFPMVDRLRCVQVRTDRYSAPLPPDTRVEARVRADYVEVWHEGRCVARHERCYRRLRKKPSALAGSTPLAQWRQAGRWPECFDHLWQALNERNGRQEGTRQMIDLLSLGTAEGWDQLRAAVEQTLSFGCQDVAAIRYLLVGSRLAKPAVEAIEIGALARYERPQPVLSACDQLYSLLSSISP